MLVEAIGGWYANSLALLSDAGHMLTDAGALGLSILALKIGTKPPSLTKTFGIKHATIQLEEGHGIKDNVDSLCCIDGDKFSCLFAEK
jgi:cobalt-zinc-cadmium efflux system protein